MLIQCTYKDHVMIVKVNTLSMTVTQFDSCEVRYNRRKSLDPKSSSAHADVIRITGYRKIICVQLNILVR